MSATSLIGILPSTFSAASSCLSPNSIFDAGGFLLQGAAAANTDFLPTAFDPQVTAYYGGTACPGGYTKACEKSQDGFSAVTCCPSVAGETFSCQRKTDYPLMGSYGCVWTLTAASLATVQGASVAKTTSLTPHWDAINAYAIQVQIGATTTKPTSGPGSGGGQGTGARTGAGTGGGTRTSTTTGSGPAAATGAGQSSASAGGLSSGAKAGIGVGVAVAGLALMTLCFCLGFRMGNGKPLMTGFRSKEIQRAPQEAGSHPISEAPDSRMSGYGLLSEMDGSATYKLAQEMEANPSLVGRIPEQRVEENSSRSPEQVASLQELAPNYFARNVK